MRFAKKDDALAEARAAAVRVTTLLPPGGLELAFVACSYDTAHEAIDAQIDEKLRQLVDVFPTDGPVRFSLTIVDDTPPDSAFGAGVERGFARAPRALLDEGRLTAAQLPGGGPAMWGRKGAALRAGMDTALLRSPDVIVYVNLNLKVDARQAATGLVEMLSSQADVVVGTRARGEGGLALGAGALGRAKSVAWSRLVQGALPALGDLQDQNAPLKLFSPVAARAIVAQGAVEGVGFDPEWLAICVRGGLSIRRFPVVWEQRAGSRPPWGLVPGMVKDLVKVVRRLR